ncbi:MAG: DEAD/DEAH box helicase [Aurantimonas endophytica]|uniref:DEAD-box ATP-dependent RNA helicase RhpA n=1 Tax=Aurantimonas endophytica TaxID=1522175 RepID=A0A7W6MN52_9HYPH|nr:DEAD/DEAH box helicase [Aurantimonas endophytica]MBB4001518.1 superfamily II DNA/RNA helicase [Aurantimonas endophytica]MCO6402841.1 DEAD/DEAH box helicase [Aurantimonas endophytica]
MKPFSELGLSAKVLAAVEAAGYSEPTPIQEQAIPHALERRDILGIAQTGTGKTASFVLPMLTLLEKGRARARMPRTLIIEPTRELAAQVEESFVRYGRDQKINIALLIGGMSFGDQDKKIDRGVDVLIATPGRLLDHFERGKLLMNAVEILVIDEADRMLDMGFIPDIERICKLLPVTRQTLFFSATMPPEITRLTEQFLQNPVRVEVAKPASAALTVTQRLVACQKVDSEKREALRRVIREETDLTNAIIFCNRKRDVATLFRSLERHGFSAGALHGDMDQRSRTAMLQSFRDNKIQLLVASDVAARGLDIPAVSHVFNFDVPIHAEDYVHRIGRTGRAGRSGKAFTLATKADKKYLDAIEKLIGTEIEWQGAPAAALPEEPADAAPSARRSSRRTDATGAGRTRVRKERPARTAEAGDEAAVPVVEAEAQPVAEPVAAVNDEPEVRAARPPRRARSESTPRPAPVERASAAPAPRAAPVDQNRGRGGDDGKAPIGFGDDIPAFMLIGTGAL